MYDLPDSTDLSEYPFEAIENIVGKDRNETIREARAKKYATPFSSEGRRNKLTRQMAPVCELIFGCHIFVVNFICK